MHVCYVDEAGDTGALTSPSTSIQPVFVLIGLILEQGAVQSLTRQWIDLKRTYFPRRLPASAKYHDWMRVEVKGADLRKMIRSGPRDDRRFALRVIDESLNLLEVYDAKVCGRVYVKGIGAPINSTAIYTYPVQRIADVFHHLVQANQSSGIIVADNRNAGKNSAVSHSILTQRFCARPDRYPLLVEMPTFGNSENHAALQLADVLCSALLFPIAAQVCSAAHITASIHCHPAYLALRSQFGARIEGLQYRYFDPVGGRWRGGITLVDPMNKFSAARLFRDRAAHPTP